MQLEQLIKAIADQRRELGFVADGPWPAAKKSHASIGQEYRLPQDDAFEGRDNS